MHDDERQIRALVATWMSATKTGDIDAVLGLMSDDVIFLVAGHPPMIGKAAYAAAKAPAGRDAPRFDGTSEVQEVTVAGDWASMWTKLTVVVTPPGGAPPITRAGYTLSILRKHGGKWLLTRDANMLSPVNP